MSLLLFKQQQKRESLKCWPYEKEHDFPPNLNDANSQSMPNLP